MGDGAGRVPACAKHAEESATSNSVAILPGRWRSPALRIRSPHPSFIRGASCITSSAEHSVEQEARAEWLRHARIGLSGETTSYAQVSCTRSRIDLSCCGRVELLIRLRWCERSGRERLHHSFVGAVEGKSGPDQGLRIQPCAGNCRPRRCRSVGQLRTEWVGVTHVYIRRGGVGFAVHTSRCCVREDL